MRYFALKMESRVGDKKSDCKDILNGQNYKYLILLHALYRVFGKNWLKTNITKNHSRGKQPFEDFYFYNDYS